MTQNALAIYKDFDGLQKAATALQKSGYFSDVKSEAQAIAKVMAGSELGLPPFASMSGIHIIQGKPTLGSNVIATLVKNDPRYDYRIITDPEDQETEMYLQWYEDGKEVGVAGFTIQEAKEAGLAHKDNWKKYTSDMLFARAISRGARRFAPGIFGGAPVYTPDEMGVDTDEEGFIEGEIITIEEPEQEPEQEKQETKSEEQNIKSEQEKSEPKSSDTNSNEPITIEKSCAMLDSEGTKYGDLPTDKLSYKFNAITKKLSDDIDDEARNEYEIKQQAIKLILKSRADGSIQ